MSTHVLVGLFDDQINGVLTTSGTPPMSTITGNYVIRVPDDIPVRNPTSVAEPAIDIPGKNRADFVKNPHRRSTKPLPLLKKLLQPLHLSINFTATQAPT